ncbi:MAG: hypothetical protein RML35_07930 [Chloroherpetonaceae bacterium]|nr:hypothetical protein [Chloroherpetonaceae bacterium]
MGQRMPVEPLRLHIVWHLDATAEMDVAASELGMPTVRHAVTGSFFPLLSSLASTPNAPATVAISSETLIAIVRYTSYLREFIDLSTNTIDAKGYLRKYGGKTDPWLDILLKPSIELTSKELDLLLNNSKTQVAHGFSVSEATLRRFPDYARLLPNDMKVGTIIGTQNRALYTVRDRIRIKFLYTVSHFDPSLLTRKYTLPLYVRGGKLATTRTNLDQPLILDLSDYFIKDDNRTPSEEDDRYELARPIGEDDCQRLVVETYKMMETILFLLRQSGLEQASTPKGKRKRDELAPSLPVDVITTPAFNALIPLLSDTEDAKTALGEVGQFPLPVQASADAKTHIVRAVARMKAYLGITPQGFVPTALMVSESSLGFYEAAGIKWLLCPKSALAKALDKSEAALRPEEIASLYQLPRASRLWLSFDETVAGERLQKALSAKNRSEELAAWLQSIEKYRNAQGVLTMRLQLPQAFHGTVSAASAITELLGMLTSVGLQKKEPSLQLTRLSRLLMEVGEKKKPLLPKTLAKLPLSAENGLEQWIGDKEEQTAWTYLALARADLERTGLLPPSVEVERSAAHSGQELTAYQQAWFKLYAAQQALWFKHYGNEAEQPYIVQQALDKAFRTHLGRVYDALLAAGKSIERRMFAPIVVPEERIPVGRLNPNEVQLDGILAEMEWFERAGVFAIGESEMPVSKCYYGITNDALCFALAAREENLKTVLSDTAQTLAVQIAFEEDRILEIELRPAKLRSDKVKLAFSDEAIEAVVPYSELKLPNQIGFLGAIAGQERTHNRDAYLGMAIIWRSRGKEYRVPKEAFKTVQEDLINTVETRFELDLSASPAARSAELEILKARSRGQQRIPMRDDGRYGDEKRNDKVWTAVLRLQRGELIEYRYLLDGESEALEQKRTWRVEDGVNTPNRAVVRDVFNKTVR